MMNLYNNIEIDEPINYNKVLKKRKYKDIIDEPILTDLLLYKKINTNINFHSIEYNPEELNIEIEKPDDIYNTNDIMLITSKILIYKKYIYKLNNLYLFSSLFINETKLYLLNNIIELSCHKIDNNILYIHNFKLIKINYSVNDILIKENYNIWIYTLYTYDIINHLNIKCEFITFIQYHKLSDYLKTNFIDFYLNFSLYNNYYVSYKLIKDFTYETINIKTNITIVNDINKIEHFILNKHTNTFINCNSNIILTFINVINI